MNDYTELLDELRHNANMCDVQIHEDYSGRFMYGRKCFGISGNFTDLLDVIVMTAQSLPDVNLIPPTRDSFGLDEIWYWPELKGNEDDD